MIDSKAHDGATPSKPLLPVRMINEYVFCPRLFGLMHIDGRWADNKFTADGQRVHKRTDAKENVLPEASGADNSTLLGDEPPQVARSVTLGSEALGIVSKLDLVETRGHAAIPVETKRGWPPDNPERSYEPERVQLMAQGLLLREQGYTCDHGMIYYAGARRRVTVAFSEDLQARTLRAIEGAHVASESAKLPEPLVDSPKCYGCSLSGICLPDETNSLRVTPKDPAAPEVRRLYPERQTTRPLYVQEQGARVGKRDLRLYVKKAGEELGEVRIRELSQLVLCGSVTISSRALFALMEADIPIVHMTSNHWFHGITRGFGLRNAFDRAAQFKVADDEARCLGLAKAFLDAKLNNQRTFIRRNVQPSDEVVLRSIKQSRSALLNCEARDQLLGHEGMAARAYFQAFPGTLRPPSGGIAFDFKGRNTRPPRDPVNAMLSFGYALLAKECTVALSAVGLDPHWGFLHQPRHGKPALALDLMEEFRPIIVDSAVMTAINTGMVSSRHFTTSSRGCSMGPMGRKGFIKAYETRLQQLTTHPVFDYRCSYRQIIALQAQVLARYLRGDLPSYQGITIR